MLNLPHSSPAAFTLLPLTPLVTEPSLSVHEESPRLFLPYSGSKDIVSAPCRYEILSNLCSRVRTRILFRLCTDLTVF